MKRVGIIVDSYSQSKQIFDLIKLSKSAENYEITTVLLNNVDRKNENLFKQIFEYIQRRGFKKFLSTLLFKSICKIESIVIKKIGLCPDFYNTFNLKKQKFESIVLNPIISQSGLVFRYPIEDLENIKKLNLDLLIRAGSGILKGEILTVCPNGVVSFHHADNEVNRGGPPGFWEVYERNPRTGFIIQKLTNELDGGDVLYKGYIQTSWFYSLNLVRLYEVANPFLNKVINDITSTNPKLVLQKKVPYYNRLYIQPNIRQSLNYLKKTTYYILSKLIVKLQGKQFRWEVGYQFSSNWNDVVLWRSHKIPNPKNHFLADPFVIKKDNTHFCFVENYNFKTRKGNISAYEISRSGNKNLGVVLDEEFHLSYPFLFEYDNNIFMCPETHEKEEIRLYKCLQFPNKWKFHKTIMRNVAAVDTNIFQFNKKWWMFTTFNKGIEDHNSQLYIFYSDNPLSDKWHAHESNPVLFDSRRARNGGMIIDDNQVYRVFQRQGFGMYGESCGVAKIISLSSTEYREEVCSFIEPKFYENIKGIHTLNFSSNLIVFDYVRLSKTKTGV